MSSRVSYKSFWIWLAIALVADFSTRQVYLFFRPAKTKPANQAEANPPALATAKPATPDPERIGAAADKSHFFYHHGWPIDGWSEEEWRGRKYLHVTDSLGFRNEKNDKVSLRKTRFRLLVIGDSNPYGVGLDWEETFGARLRRAFPRAEVLNASAPSYSPATMEAKLTYLIGQKGFEADAVLLFIDIADIDDELSYERRPDGSVWKAKPFFGGRPENRNWADLAEKASQEYLENNFTVLGALIRNLRQWLRRHCRVFGFMAYEKGRWAEYDGHLNRQIEDGIIRGTSALTRLSEFLKSQKTKMILVISPGSSQMDYLDPDSRAQAVWQSWGSANAVPVISLYPEFFAQAPVYPSMVQSSGHWNSKGHELVADVLIRQLPDLLPELRPKP